MTKFQDRVPHVNPKGVEFILEVIELRDPRAKNFAPESVIDSDFVQELEKSGLIDALWKR